MPSGSWKPLMAALEERFDLERRVRLPAFARQACGPVVAR